MEDDGEDLIGIKIFVYIKLMKEINIFKNSKTKLSSIYFAKPSNLLFKCVKKQFSQFKSKIRS